LVARQELSAQLEALQLLYWQQALDWHAHLHVMRAGEDQAEVPLLTVSWPVCKRNGRL
jgi:hypothetical protein